MNSANRTDDARPPFDVEIPLTRAIDLGQVTQVEQLLLAGADPNAPDGSGLTPMAVAAMSNAPHLLKLLRRHGGDINAVDAEGWTALHYAVDHSIDSIIQCGGSPGDEPLEAIAWLLSNGANLDATLPDGTTPLALAQSYGSDRIVALLQASIPPGSGY